MWLLVTEVEGIPAGLFTAMPLPSAAPRAGGGDVLIRLGGGPGRTPGTPAGHVQLYAVMAGTLVLAGEWGLIDFGDWPEVVRITAAFTMGALADLEEHDADLRPYDHLDLESAAGTAVIGFPAPGGAPGAAAF
jgi:hypothetical protein